LAIRLRFSSDVIGAIIGAQWEGLGRKPRFGQIHRWQLRRSISGSQCKNWIFFLTLHLYLLFSEELFWEDFFFFFQDPAKKEFGEKLISYVDTFTKELYSALKGDPIQQASKYGFGFMNRGKSCLSPYEINLQNWGF